MIQVSGVPGEALLVGSTLSLLTFERNMRRYNFRRGFTLIELLIVVAIIGIIAAIAIPNLLNAIQRGKQKRTMADIRSIATSVEAFAVDNNMYPSGGSPVRIITSDVEPVYIKKLPTLDAWSDEIQYYAGSPPSPTGTTVNPFPQEYTIESFGKDGINETSIFRGATTNFNNDIVFSQGSFISFPEGIQQ